MTINLEKKHFVIGAVVLAAIILGIVGIGAAKNATYMKRAKHCQKDIHELYFASSLLSAELHDVWSDYIREDKVYINSKTGKFYNSKWTAPDDADLHYCSNFSNAVSKAADFYENKGVNKYIDSLYSAVKGRMTKMTPAPKKYAEIHANLTALFHSAEAMYNCASSPDGSLMTYTQMINSTDAEYKKLSSQVDIEIGELDKDTTNDAELEILMKFL